MKKTVVLASFLALMLVMTACGGNSGGSSANNNAGSDGSDNEMEADNTLDIEGKNFNFGETTFKVKAGEPVTINFKSTEGVHGLAIDEFDINISSKGTATFTPEKPGKYIIYCNIPCGNGHKDMKSTLIVE